ncbi:MAG: motility protein A [Pirellulaceae bacterium]|nr:motility protein A [Planctomycetales bacterium]
MDIATVIGLVLGMGLILSSIAMGSGGLTPFIDIPSGMIVIGGAFAAILISFPLKSVLSLGGIVKNCFLSSLPSTKQVIEQFNDIAAIARRDGLLALENKLPEVKDRFMYRGLEMVIGGTAKEDLQSVMETEISYVEERHKVGKKIIDMIGAAAPAFGMIGTLVGLVQMLGTLDDPSKIGGGMAVALLTTLYGAVVANLFCIPLASKLEARSKEEILIRELMLVGLLCLIEGQTPRALQERLIAFLSPKDRPRDESQTAA